MFAVGDVVELSAGLLLSLAEKQPDLFQHLVASKIVGGPVDAVEGYEITIDLGADRPFIVVVDPSDPYRLITVVSRNDGDTDVVPVESGLAQASADMGGIAQSVLGGNFPASQMQVPPPQAHPQHQCQHDPSPNAVRLAQNVINHFADMKRFVITQDVAFEQRRRAYRESRPFADNALDEVYSPNDARLPLRADLTDAETKLYEESLDTVLDWLTILRKRELQPESVPAAATAPV